MKNFLLLLVLCFSLAIYGKTQQKIDLLYSTEIVVSNYLTLNKKIAFSSLKKEEIRSLSCSEPAIKICYQCIPRCRSPAPI